MSLKTALLIAIAVALVGALPIADEKNEATKAAVPEEEEVECVLEVVEDIKSAVAIEEISPSTAEAGERDDNNQGKQKEVAQNFAKNSNVKIHKSDKKENEGNNNDNGLTGVREEINTEKGNAKVEKNTADEGAQGTKVAEEEDRAEINGRVEEKIKTKETGDDKEMKQEADKDGDRNEKEDKEHKMSKRSLLRMDNVNNDLLAAGDILNFESDRESSLIGHKIKFLPSWAG